MNRFVTVWNSFAGVAGFGADLKPVKKFENRDKAVARIWKALQRLNEDATPEDGTAAETANAAPAGMPHRRPRVFPGRAAGQIFYRACERNQVKPTCVRDKPLACMLTNNIADLHA